MEAEMVTCYIRYIIDVNKKRRLEHDFLKCPETRVFKLFGYSLGPKDVIFDNGSGATYIQ